MSAPFKTIVVLIDLSKDSADLIAQARALAKIFSSNVVLMHGVPKHPATLDVGIVSPVVLRDPAPEEWDAHKHRLLELCDSLTKDGINATAAQVQEITGESVVMESKWLDADLIIVGSHHHSALREWFVGSLTHGVITHAHCPVLVIPAEVSAEPKAENKEVPAHIRISE